MLNGIDVSSNQPANICKMVDYDFAIVKMGGNPHGYKWSYVNPSAMQQVTDALKRSGCAGLYWFCWGKLNPYTEANRFVREVKNLGLLGKVMLVVDYEANAIKRGRKWLGRLCGRVEKLAGYKPVIYAPGSVIESQKLGTLGYPIWCANYSKGSTKIAGYNRKGCTLYYKDAVMWQYTEYGYLKGYVGKLDLDAFFGDKLDFQRLCGHDPKVTGYTTKAVRYLYRNPKKILGQRLVRIPKGARLEYLGKKSGNWRKVRYNGRTGWVYRGKPTAPVLKAIKE